MQNQKCRNCGGTDHVEKFCYERPKRKIVKIEKPRVEVIKKKQVMIPKSKYEEEKQFGQHTEVWGSYWNEVMGWGFACCYSNTKTEECLGEKGKRKSLTKEYLIKRTIEETPVEQYPVNLAQLYNTSLLREGPQIEIGPQLLKK